MRNRYVPTDTVLTEMDQKAQSSFQLAQRHSCISYPQHRPYIGVAFCVRPCACSSGGKRCFSRVGVLEIA